MPATATASRKRKQTEDMDESPPKRVTRARAAKNASESTTRKAQTTKGTATTTKASLASDAKVKKTTTKITTASVKAAAAAKATSKTTTTLGAVSKRKAGQPVDEDSGDELERVEEPVPLKRLRGRPRKEEQAATTADSPKAKGRAAKSTVPTATAPAPTAPSKVRARKVADAKQSEAEPSDKATAATKGGRETSKASSYEEPTISKRTASRKKVTFDDETTDDKENLPAKGGRKAGSKLISTGSTTQGTAPPRAASAKASTSKAPVRTRKGRKPATKRSESDSRPSTPLSPKKVTQVAKSASSGSEDELCDKSPVRALSKSPKKAPLSVHSIINVAPQPEPRPPTPHSPSKDAEISSFRSPAKRPPPSPFKDAIKHSPVKFTLNTSLAKAEDTAGQPQLHNSLLGSPRKLNLPMLTERGSASPKRSPSKAAALLTSPPKRPISPEKSRLFPSPSKSLSSRVTEPKSNEGTEAKVPTITPRRLLISPPQEIALSDTETQLNESGDHDSSNPVYTSPAKVAFVQYNSNPLAAYKAELTQQGKLPAPGTPCYRPQTNYDSDDERSTSPSKPRDDGTPTFIFKTPNGVVHRRETMGITPLAMKMSAWYPSSPEERQPQNQLPDEITSPVSLANGEDSDSSVIRTDGVGPQNTNFFEEEMVAREETSEPLQMVTPALIEDLHSAEILDAVQPDSAFLNYQVETDAVCAPGDLVSDSYIGQEALTAPSEGNEHAENLAVDEAPIAVHEDPSKAAPGAQYPYTFEMNGIEPVVMSDQSQELEKFGDENAIPIDPLLLGDVSFQNIVQETSQKQPLSTPQRTATYRHREIHTVSKVPLRVEGPDESPIKIPRKRSKSSNGPLGELSDLSQPSAVDDAIVTQALSVLREHQQRTPSPRKISYETSIINALMTPRSGSKSNNTSPIKSARTGQDAQILRGAVIYVDVHTSEGADASSIFVELLTQMGARCVKQWSWNPRQHAGPDGTPSRGEGTPSGKVGITHVVFKDGGKRTLQKIREAKGLVLCVGVSWVLDCERENKWLDEAPYAVDSSTIPRGGHNRRKSMEPRMVSNQGGTLVPAATPSKGGYEVSSPTAEFRSFSAASRRSSIRVLPLDDLNLETEEPPAPTTPLRFVPDGDEMCDLASWTNDGGASPTTPYYLSKGTELLQQTCPPKTLGQRLFPVSGRIEDQPDEGVRQRLIAARRKSLQWAPKVKSPLGRTVSYGKQ